MSFTNAQTEDSSVEETQKTHDLAELTDRLKAVAAIIAEANNANASWSEETLISKRSKLSTDVTTLRLMAGDQVWSGQARVHEGDVDAARELVATTMLAKLASSAGVCSSCYSEVPRHKREAGAAPRRYRCPECMFGWME